MTSRCGTGLSICCPRARVGGKAASDYAEVFDGVPSAHDGKDAAIVAELAAIGKSRAWPIQDTSSWEAEVEGQVQWMDTQQAILQLWQGRLEGLLARHWTQLGLAARRNLPVVMLLLLPLMSVAWSLSPSLTVRKVVALLGIGAVYGLMLITTVMLVPQGLAGLPGAIRNASFRLPAGPVQRLVARLEQLLPASSGIRQ